MKKLNVENIRPISWLCSCMESKTFGLSTFISSFWTGFSVGKVVKMACGCQKGTPLVWITPHKVFKIGSYNLYFNCTSMNQRDNLYLIIDIFWYFFFIDKWNMVTIHMNENQVCCRIDSFLLSKVYAVWHANTKALIKPLNLYNVWGKT